MSSNVENSEMGRVLEERDQEMEVNEGVGAGVADSEGESVDDPMTSLEAEAKTGQGGAGEVTDQLYIDLTLEGISGTIKGLMKCAKTCLMGFQGPEHKRQRNKALKTFHKASVALVATKLRLQQVPDLVDSICTKMDIEVAAASADIDDEEYFSMVKELGVTCLKHMPEVDMEAVDKDEEYQEFLELLNQFYDRTKPAAQGAAVCSSTQAGSDKSKVKTGVASEEGIEALTDFIPVRDPVTLQYFKDPRVNWYCGHVYEYSTIEHIEFKRCPYPGCNNNERVTRNDMRVDKVLKQKIMEKIRSETAEN